VAAREQSRVLVGAWSGGEPRKGKKVIQIENAIVETLDATQARPVSMGGRTQLSVTIGDHTFDMWVDEAELVEALASQYRPTE